MRYTGLIEGFSIQANMQINMVLQFTCMLSQLVKVSERLKYLIYHLLSFLNVSTIFQVTSSFFVRVILIFTPIPKIKVMLRQMEIVYIKLLSIIIQTEINHNMEITKKKNHLLQLFSDLSLRKYIILVDSLHYAKSSLT